jgi:hypothetical protein
MNKYIFFILIPFSILVFFVCGDDEEKESDNKAVDIGIGGTCVTEDDCKTEGLTCLIEFKGGYCGSKDCTKNEECPKGGICVAHTDGTNYCFLTCQEKVDCNENRGKEEDGTWANCSGSFSYASTEDEDALKDLPADAARPKACIPPSG